MNRRHGKLGIVVSVYKAAGFDDVGVAEAEKAVI